jgi:hypothetical protein
MKPLTSLLLPALLLIGGEAFGAADGFDAVRCGADIPAALRGRTMSQETVVTIEKRHPDLALKDLGADELEKGGSLTSWRICGGEFMLIEDQRSVVRDVLKVPPHSRSAPQSSGPCTRDDRAIPGAVVAILQNQAGAADLPATVAWGVDEKAGRFVPLPTKGVRCSRSGISTVDGGT